MSASDVLNPSTGISNALGFNPNWNYGSSRKAGANRTTFRPRAGVWTRRTTGNLGYSFPLTFVDRPLAQLLYLQHFFQTFDVTDGFTLIDFDNESRHHVGVFTTEPQERHGANGKYTIEVTFEDIPGAAMLKYPTDVATQGQYLYVVDGRLNLRVAIMQGAWTPQLIPNTPVVTGPLTVADSMDPSGSLVFYQTSAQIPALYELLNENATAGDWSQTAYTGWGFLMRFRIDPSFGKCDIYVDGQLLVAALDLSSGAAGATTPPALVYQDVPVYAGGAGSGTAIATVVSCTALPLGQHRIKIVASANVAGASEGTALIFPMVTYFY